jgi:hypothetical protein
MVTASNTNILGAMENLLLGSALFLYTIYSIQDAEPRHAMPRTFGISVLKNSEI